MFKYFLVVTSFLFSNAFAKDSEKPFEMTFSYTKIEKQLVLAGDTTVVIEGMIGAPEKEVAKLKSNPELLTKSLKLAMNEAKDSYGITSKRGKFLLKGDLLNQLDDQGVHANDVWWTYFVITPKK